MRRGNCFAVSTDVLVELSIAEAPVGSWALASRVTMLEASKPVNERYCPPAIKHEILGAGQIATPERTVAGCSLITRNVLLPRARSNRQ